MFTTILEAFVSTATEGFKNSFIVFIPHGYLFEFKELGQFFLSLRCSMCAYTYGVLVVHFYYRYLSICQPYFIIHFFELKYISVTILLVFLYGSSWMLIIFLSMLPNDEVHEMLNEDFQRTYGCSSFEIPLIVAHYKFPIDDFLHSGVVGMISATIITLLAVFIDILFALKIHKTLQIKSMSGIVKRLHKNVLVALVAQTTIPFCTTCIPCILVWFYPFLQLNIGIEVNSYIVPFLSAYPAIDPIVITLIVTDYRKSLFSIFKRKIEIEQSRTNMVKNTKQKKRARKSSSNKQKDQVAHKKPRKKVEENNNVVDTELYEVEDIIDCKFNGKEVVYKVRWVGYAPKYDSFEPEFRLMCPDKIKDFAIKKFSCNYSNTDIDMIMEGFEKYCDELFIESANYLAIIGKRFFERGSVSYIEHNTITANKRFLKSIKNFKNDWCFYTLNKNDVTSSANDMKQYMRDVERRIQTSIDYPLVRVFFVSSKDQTTAPPPIKNLTFDLLLPPDDRKRILKRENRKEHPFTSKEPENESKLNSRWDFLNDPMKKKIKCANQFKVNLSLRYREEVGWKLCADHFVAKDSAILQMAGEASEKIREKIEIFLKYMFSSSFQPAEHDPGVKNCKSQLLI
ncbi:unnamed protein product [Caenorhabditis angaria]|uniref:Chromo domain-containing protein n=1 Tax=Caenorhabditis angaria TaxID=860376 RepID=A0A9P1IUL6_9PELO|nr:unnamed protein product [Caenorhabditis angaria]